MSFSTDGSELYVANKKVHVLRVDWVTRKLMTGWDIDLTPFGVKDSRSVEVIHDRFYVGDGYDGRATGDPLRYAVFVFDVCCGTTPAPTASFTSTQAASPDNTINFVDTSTNSPTSWAWDFDNNGTTDSTTQNPQHTFPAAGDYPVKLTATNGGGPGSVTQVVHVNAPNPVSPTANFTFAPGGSTHSVQFTDTSTGAPTGWAWTFGDGATSTQQSPPHTFPAAGIYSVTLTASNGQGSTSVTKSVTVSDPSATTTFTPTDDAYVSWSSPTKNYAAYTDLKVLANTGAYEYHPYFQFSVSGLSGAPTAAKLRLFVTDGGSSGANWFTTAGGWLETALNWNNAPAITGSPFASVTGAVTAGQWIEIDVTSKITGNGTYSFAATTGATDTVAFGSKESANAPQLVVTP
jgi:PKD repeat protein